MPRVMLAIDWENGDGMDLVEVGQPIAEIRAEFEERFKDKLEDPDGVQTHLFLEQVNRRSIKAHVDEIVHGRYREQFDSPRVLADLAFVTHNIDVGEQVVLKVIEISNAEYQRWASGDEGDVDEDEEPTA